MAIIGIFKIGGLQNLFSSLPAGHLYVFNFGGISWMIMAVLIGGFTLLGRSADWQRTFSAESPEVARKAYFLAIPFILILAIIVILLGLFATVLIPGVVPEQATFLLMYKLLPPAFIGIGLASILAVVMSTIDSLLVAGSTIVYNEMDNGKIRNKLRTIRMITVIFGVLSVLVAFLFPKIVLLALFVAYAAIIFVPGIIVGFTNNKISSNAVFYSILIPIILLIISFPILKEKSFVAILVGVVVILFYDKVFRRK